jgi:CHAT domain-containing protein
MCAKLRQRKKILKGFVAFGHNIMEQKDMEEQKAIREYLLGALNNKAEMRRIEEKILLEEDFVEKLSVAEDQLIDEYLDGALDASEHKNFDRFFLAMPERKQKLRLISNLRKYAASSEKQTVKQFPKEKNAFFDWRRFISLPSFRLATAALLFLIVGFGVWRAVLYQSDVDKGLAQLQVAYRGQRPIEARTTINSDYVPLSVTRGNNDIATNEKARRRAELILAEAAENTTDAESHHALGLVFLADKKFDKALAEFNLALKISPDDAGIHSDLGAVFFELGKKAVLEKDGAKGWEFFDKSLKHLERAIALDPKLLEPKFNRALCLQAFPASEQAKQAWREYLELDPSSKWAEEARQNLETLESQKTENLSAAELERDFLLAVKEKNEEQAWQLLSRNRELISEKYLPQRLAISYLNASGAKRKDFLAALVYAGELEKTHIGDSFAAELARFYIELSEDKAILLRQAQSFVRNGYEHGRDENYKDALREFKSAHSLFIQSGDIWEAELSKYSIAYYLYYNKLSESLLLFSQVADFCQSKNYKWLHQSAVYWVASSYVALRKYTQAKKNYQKALSLAEEIKDSYAVQKNLNGLANVSSSVGQPYPAIAYMQRVLEESSKTDTSLRQKWRNNYETLKVLISAKFYNMAKVFGAEAMHLAEENNNAFFTTLSYIGTGSAYVQSENYAEAREWLTNARRKAETMTDESVKKNVNAFSVLRLAHLDRQTGSYEKSLQYYNEAINIYETLELPFYLYEAYKGRVLANLALGNDAQLEKQIPVTLNLAEYYREQISEEQERNSFYNTEQSIYDIAVGYEFGRGRYEEAYDYTEMSNSRSLLDWLQKGAKISGDKEKLGDLSENANPLRLSEIRQRMPENAQLLQYSVLEDKVLIWLVSKEKFVVIPADIKADELRRKVESYLKLLKQKDEVKQAEAGELASELYGLLIKPIFNQLDPSQDVCIIPNKILFYLPFAALISQDAKPFLAEFNIFYAPSANVFLLCSENAQKKAVVIKETLLSVGNPAFDSKEYEGLRDLPAAKTEAQYVAAFYDKPKILLGEEAVKTAFQNSMRNVEVIHFAGHYVVAPNAPLSSSILLAKNGKEISESVLTNSELIGESLPRVKLVVLSACQTGVENYYNGEGLIGLSRTFLVAGAPLVVASQWEVDSNATAELMKRFHFYRRKEKMSTASALRRAQLEMLEAEDKRFNNPYYWAAFAAFGGYTTF